MKLLRSALFVALGSVLFVATPLLAQSTSAYLPVVDQIDELYAYYDLHAVSFSDGSIYVSVATKTGEVVFESRYPVVKADGRYIEWQYLAEPRLSMSRRLDPNAIRTLKEMTFNAKDVVRLIRRGHVDRDGKFVANSSHSFVATPDGKKLMVRALDNFGCDWPFEEMSCTANGNCCDQHDFCYALWGCDALSWLGLASPMCTACNEAVVACITLNIYNTGQPSECCAAGNCGQPRPSDYYGTPTGVVDDPKSWEELVIGDGGGGGGGGGSLPSYMTYFTPYGSVSYGGGTCRIQTPWGEVTLPCG